MSLSFFHILLYVKGALYLSVTGQQVKGKAVPLQARRGPEGFRKLRFPDFVATAQDGGKVVSLTHRPLYPQEILLINISVTRLSRPQGHSAIGRILCQ